jgi:hypothetical protein
MKRKQIQAARKDKRKMEMKGVNGRSEIAIKESSKDRG